MWSSVQRVMLSAAPGSSPVDWCENNYSISPNIAEFVNTISNVLFFILPPVLMHLFKEYAEYVNPAIHIVWVLLMIVGASSAYFHATLSLIGQLLDELAILWVCMAAFTLFLPKRYFPNFCNKDRRAFAVLSSLFSIMLTGFLVVHPALNAFALMTLALPALLFLFGEMKRVTCPRVYRLGVRCAGVWGLSVICWVNDRMFCEMWTSIHFPYLHGFWHIFIFIAGYTALVLFSYFTVKEERPDQVPILKYWPSNDFELGIPYVSLRKYSKEDADSNI